MKRLYAVYDSASDSYGPIFGCPHDSIAVREFAAAMQQERSVFAQYPDAFALYFLGVFFDVEPHVQRVLPLVEDGGMTNVVVPAESPEIPCVGEKPKLVISARQWLDAQPRQAEQLSLVKEA